MLMAHLRGLLKPDYLNGARSVVREMLVLDALEMERYAELGLKQMSLSMQMDLLCSKLTHRGAADAAYREMSRSFQRLAKLSCFDMAMSAVPEAKGSVEELTQLFYALGKAGLVTLPEEAQDLKT